jgi:methylated-DNA-[protein]-cysteine S-methyltransferase
MKSYYEYDMNIGRILIASYENRITNISLNNSNVKENWIREENNLIQNAYQQLEEYLKGIRKQFDLPLQPEGTNFQKSVWNALTRIPYGKTCSYKEIAEAISNPKACRAVGMANNKNPIMIIIPCHRVIGSKGNLVGYGAGLLLKEQLINLEKQHYFRT